jgi:hypothetical protein
MSYRGNRSTLVPQIPLSSDAFIPGLGTHPIAFGVKREPLGGVGTPVRYRKYLEPKVILIWSCDRPIDSEDNGQSQDFGGGRCAQVVRWDSAVRPSVANDQNGLTRSLHPFHRDNIVPEPFGLQFMSWHGRRRPGIMCEQSVRRINQSKRPLFFRCIRI